MKITFVVSGMRDNGAARTVSYLTEYFSRQKDTHVELIVISKDSFYDIDPKVKVTLMNSTTSSNLFLRFVRTLKRVLKLRKYICKTKPDTVICFFPRMITYLYGLKKKVGFRLIASERNNPVLEGQARFSEIIRTYKHADKVIFQTERVKQVFDSAIQEKGVVIPNAIGNKFALDYELKGNRTKKISAMGRLALQKDYPTLLKAFAIVNKKYPDYKLEIFGIGSLQDELIQLTKELNIEENVLFMGVAPDAIIKIADASCYVMSSLFEGMPNALMEAMAVGLPCVSTDCPFGPAELIENGVNGLLVPVGDANAIAEAIIKFIENPEFAKECGKNASKIKETHSIEKNAQQYYETIITS